MQTISSVSHRWQCRRWPVFFMGLLTALLLTHMQGMAQSSQGSIVGTVTDATGGAISGAAVKLTNVNLGTVRSARTSTSGGYEFLNAVAGLYQIEVTASGFKNWVQINTQLSAQQELRVDAKLAVGRVSQTVEVNGDYAGTIETDTPQITSVLSGRELQDLPTNSRAGSNGTAPFYALESLPGLSWDYQQSGGNAIYQLLFVPGSASYQVLIQVDGITNMSTAANHSEPALLPSSDSISEVSVDGVMGSAEHSSPAEISFTTKGGTNAFHGAAWEYHQDSSLNGTPYGSAKKPHFVGNTYGVNLGGPVVIPHLYNGRNKSFFWFLYEGFQYPKEKTIQNSVPTSAILNGDFTNYIIADKNGNDIFQGLVNPATGKVCGYTFAACGFSINSVAKQFLQFYPQPNHAATVNLANGSILSVPTTEYVSGQSKNYWVNKSNGSSSNEFDIRGDQYLGRDQKFLVWGRYSQNNFPTVYPNDILIPSSTNVNTNRDVLISANYAVNRNMVNEFRFGYMHEFWGYENSFDGKSFTQGLGLQGLQNLWFSSLPDVRLQDFQGIRTDRLNYGYGNTAWDYVDYFTWVKGRHTLKFGAEVQHLIALNPNSINGGDQYGTFRFGGSPQYTGVGWADFLLGIPYQTSYDVVSADSYLVQSGQHYFAQDEWHITPRLTLTYGVRYEFNPGFYDVNGAMANLDLSVPQSGRFIYPNGTSQSLNKAWLAGVNACDPDGINNSNSATLNGAPCTPVVTNSQAGLPSALRKNTHDRFLPRAGFAYRLTADSRWVVRGGYGIYNNYISAASVTKAEPLMLQSGYTTYNNSYQGGGTFGTPLMQWPAISYGSGSAAKTTSPGQADIRSPEVVNWVDPYTEQWVLSLDHDLGKGYGAQISYIGSASHHLVWQPSLNVFPYSSTTPAYNQPISARPFPNFGNVATLDTSANSNYHGVEVEFIHRFQRGFSFNSNVVYGRGFSDNQGTLGTLSRDDSGGLSTYLDRHLDYGADQGPSNVDWKTNSVYNLPIGRGKQFGATMPRALDIVIGGWSLSNVFDWKTGVYFTANFSAGGDPSGTGMGNTNSAAGYDANGNNQRPDRVAGVSVKASHQSGAQWLNPSAFSCPGDSNWAPGFSCYTGNAPGIQTTFNGNTYVGKENVNGALYTIPAPIGRFGNGGVSNVPGPQFVQLDSGLSKVFSVGERFKLRAEGTFTNVLNHTNLDGMTMTTNADSRNYGNITKAIAPRNGQVSLRLDF